MKKIISLIIFIVFIVFVLFYAQDVYKEFKESFKEQKIEKTLVSESEEIFSAYTNLKIDLKSEGLSYEEFLEGFWYEKDGELYFFSVEELIKMGYSKEEIIQMMNKLKNSKISKFKNIEYIANEDMPEDAQFFNSLNASSSSLNPEVKYNDIKSTLENKENKTASDFQKLSQIYSLEGKYIKAKEMSKKACELDSEFCEVQNIEFSGDVFDQYGKPVSDVKIYLASDESKFIKTKQDGSYIFKSNLSKFNKDRLIFKKFGFATTFQGVVSVSESQTKYKVPKTTLYQGKYIYNINNVNNTVDNGGKFENDYFFVSTQNSKYKIPKNAFYTKTGEEYKGKIVANLFEFDKETVPESLVSLDSFSDEGGLLGSFFVTFGMPYPVFQDSQGNTLYILKKNPAILEYTSPQTEHVKIITPEENKIILEKSKEGSYYYTADNISKSFVKLIPFWCLDQKTGVWDNTGFDVLNEIGTLRTRYYTAVK